MTWDLRSVYEGTLRPHGAWVNPEVYSRTFPQEHVIEGHKVKCIFARPQQVTVSHLGRSVDGVSLSRVEGVLLVEAREMSGLRRGESLRIDGQVYRISALSEPVPGLWRAELSGGQ